MEHCRNQVPSRSNCRKYETELLDDDFMELGYFHKALSEKTNTPNLTSIATMTAVTEQDLAMEYKILTRLPDDFSA